MSPGTIHASYWSLVTFPDSNADSLRLIPFLWAFLAIALAASYPMWGFSAVTSINELSISSLILLSLATIPLTQLLVKHCAGAERDEAHCVG